MDKSHFIDGINFKNTMHSNFAPWMKRYYYFYLGYSQVSFIQTIIILLNFNCFLAFLLWVGDAFI
jgi:D-alanyl-lipoteichoic acid acyltransferase DltB (MBOAT superfamily)